jgi:uncharacterized protein YycO
MRPIPDTPFAGDFGLSIMPGFAGFLVRIGQAVIGDTTKYTHAWLVIDDYGTVVEAYPGGARLTHVDVYRGQDVYYHRSYYLTDRQRDQIRFIGRHFVGTPYSFLDYAYLSLAFFKIKPAWLKRRVADTGHMICSQLVDEALRRAGHHIFNDGRIPQDITPGDLFWAALRRDLAKP